MRGETLGHCHSAPGTVGNLSRGASGNLGHTFGGVSVILDAASWESDKGYIRNQKKKTFLI